MTAEHLEHTHCIRLAFESVRSSASPWANRAHMKNDASVVRFEEREIFY